MIKTFNEGPEEIIIGFYDIEEICKMLIDHYKKVSPKYKYSCTYEVKEHLYAQTYPMKQFHFKIIARGKFTNIMYFVSQPIIDTLSDSKDDRGTKIGFTKIFSFLHVVDSKVNKFQELIWGYSLDGKFNGLTINSNINEMADKIQKGFEEGHINKKQRDQNMYLLKSYRLRKLFE